MKNLVCLLCLSGILFSCNKNPVDSDKKIFLHKKTYSNGGGSYIYNYDQNGKLESIDQANHPSGFIYQRIVIKGRNAAGEILEYHTEPTDPGTSTIKYVIHYDAFGRRDTIKTYGWPSNVLGDIRIYEYPTGKVLEKDFSSNYQLRSSREAILTTDGKNIKEFIYYNVSTGLIESRTVYTSWDTNKNPETLVPLAFSLAFTDRNNFLTSYAISQTGDTLHRNQTYTYNNDGYPVLSVLNGTNITNSPSVTYEYIYK